MTTGIRACWQGIACLAAGLSAMTAWAGWEQVGANDKVYLLVDRQTRRQDGPLVRMTHLVDYKLRPPESGVSYQSSKIETEYDCHDNRFRDLSATFHAYRLAEGAPLAAQTLGGNWQAIPPDSTAALLADIACQRPKKSLPRDKR